MSASKCPFCHYHIITDDFVYVCQSCGTESCPDCAGRCGCECDESENDNENNNEDKNK
jgi:hypothetical protein